MQFLHDLNIRHELNVPLAPRTWYGVGGNAKVLAHPASIEQLAQLARRCHEQSIPVYVLGSGANLLVADSGVDGVVVELDAPAFRALRIEGSLVTAGAGYDLAKLVLETAKAGLSGLQALAGIPATVGGAVRMNAGGAFGDTGRSVRRVQVMDAAGQRYALDRDDLVFAYRRTNITAKFILEVEFELTPDDPDELMRRVKEVFLYKKNTQPLADHSAGCAFKNPSPPAAPVGPAVPAVEGADTTATTGGATPLSAGRLIDQAGLKGFRSGGAQVSDHHANFIVTVPGETCTASDILAVMAHVQRTVQEKFGVALECEVVVWP